MFDNKATVFTILHLSDTHFKSTDSLTDIKLTQLRKAMAKLAKTGLSPDLILFTGDVVFSGKEGEYAIATKFFDDLLKDTGIEDKERLFVVPGNHDVDPKKIINVIRDRTGAMRKGTDQQSHDFFQSKKNLKLFLRKFHGFQAFSRKYLGKRFDEDNHCFTRFVNIKGFKIGIAGLNSAWLAEKDDSKSNKKQLLGVLPLLRTLDKLDDADLKIVLFHHPWHELMEYETHCIKENLEHKADLAFCGHQIKPDLEPIRPTPVGDANARHDDEKCFCYIQGGPAYHEQEWPNRFFLIQFEIESKHKQYKAIELIPYKFDPVNMVWTLDTTMFPESPNYTRRVTLSKLNPRPEMVNPALQTLIHELNGELLNEDKLSHPASKDAIFNFYCGAPLTWSLIAADGDIRRKQEKEVLDLALSNVDDFQIVSIVAEPGAGKSTLAWRAAHELFRKGNMVIRFNGNNTELWAGDKLWRLASHIGRPFYVLIDDMFRNRRFVEELNYMTKDGLAVSVLGTARSSEFHIPGLERIVKKLELKLDKKEKADLLNRLGKSYATLSKDEQFALDSTTLFLVLGMVLTKGKEFKRIIESIIYSLMGGSGSLYSAFQYVCMSYSYGVSVPEVLLCNLDNGTFDDILGKEQARGVFYEDPQPESDIRFIRVGHQVIAEEAINQFKKNDDFKPQFNARKLFKRMLEAADEEDLVQRTFMANLTSAISSKSEDVKIILDEIDVGNVKIGKLLNRALISELDVWRTIFSRLGKLKGVEKCSEQILSRVPTTSSELHLLTAMHLQQRTGKALLTMEAWIEKNPDDAATLSRYLSLVREIGNRDQKEQSVTRAIDWLGQHPEDRVVRATLFSILRTKGYEIPRAQIDQIIDESRVWLGNHMEETVVREGFIVLVRELGSTTHVEETLQNTFSWLKDHPDDSKIRSVFTTLVRDKGLSDRERIKEALEELEQYMEKHGPQILFQDYITLVRKINQPTMGLHINDELVRSFGDQFLRSCHWIYEVKTIENFADWLRDRREFQEPESIYQKLESLEVQNRRVMAGICFGFGKLLLSEAMTLPSADERVAKLSLAEKKFRKALLHHRGHHMAHTLLSITLNELGKKNEAEEEFRSAELFSPFDSKTRMTLYSTARPTPEVIMELNEGKIPAKIREDFEAMRKPLSTNAKLFRLPSIKNRWKIVDGPESNSEIYLVLLEKTRDKKSAIRTYGDFSFGECFYKIGVFYYRFGRFEDALRWLDSAAAEDPNNFANWMNLGCVEMDIAKTLEQKGQWEAASEFYSNAVCSLEISLRKAPPFLHLPASEDIPARIEECKKHLEKLGPHDYLIIRAVKGRDDSIVGHTVEGKTVLFDDKYLKNRLVRPGDTVKVVVVRSARTFDIVRVVSWIE